jgi:hypothetical protein
MQLKVSKDGHEIKPTYVNRGSWIPLIWRYAEGDFSNALLACAVRCIPNHAPIGEYYQKFDIPDTLVDCLCRVDLQTHDHIIVDCPCYGLINERLVDALDLEQMFRHKFETLSKLISFFEEATLGVFLCLT